MSRADITRAYAQGLDAGRDRAPVSTCPYPLRSLLRRAWFRGYARARPPAPVAETLPSADQ